MNFNFIPQTQLQLEALQIKGATQDGAVVHCQGQMLLKTVQVGVTPFGIKHSHVQVFELNLWKELHRIGGQEHLQPSKT